MEFTFVAAKKLNRVNKMGMEGCGPSHPRSSNASFDPINYSCASFEIAAIEVRLKEVVVVIEASWNTLYLMMMRIQIHGSKA